MRIYVAAPFALWPHVRQVYDKIRARSDVITCDWTVGAEDTIGQTDADVSDGVALKAARADAEGVISAEGILLLTLPDKSQGCGMWCELGIGIGLNYATNDPGHRTQKIAICGPQRDRTIFSRFGKRFETEDEGIDYLFAGA